MTEETTSFLSHPRAPAPGFMGVWIAALAKYQDRTGINLCDVAQNYDLDKIESEDSALMVLQDTSLAFDGFRASDARWQKLRNALKPVVRVAIGFNDAVGEAAASQPAVPGGKAIFAAISVLLKGTQEVSNRFDTLSELFERLERFLGRLKIRAHVSYSEESRKIIVEVLVELLNILAIATQTMKKTRFRLLIDTLFKNDSVKAALARLDCLTLQELQVTVVETLSITSQVSEVQSSLGHRVSQVHGSLSRSMNGLRSAINAQRGDIAATREMVTALHQGLHSLCHVLSANSPGTTPIQHVTPPAEGRRLAILARERLAEVVDEARRGDSMALLLCLSLIIACSSNLPAVRVTVQAAGIQLFVFGLWQALMHMSRSIAPVVNCHASNTITLVDLLGTRISLDMQFCASPDSLHDVLLLLFNKPEKKGGWFVRNRRYELVKAGEESSVTQNSWRSVVLAGAELLMNALVEEQGSGTTCPSCLTVISGYGIETNRWVTCVVCNTEFKISKADAKAHDRASSSPITSQADLPDSPLRNFSGVSTSSRSLPETLDDVKYCRRIRMLQLPVARGPLTISPVTGEAEHHHALDITGSQPVPADSGGYERNMAMLYQVLYRQAIAAGHSKEVAAQEAQQQAMVHAARARADPTYAVNLQTQVQQAFVAQHRQQQQQQQQQPQSQQPQAQLQQPLPQQQTPISSQAQAARYWAYQQQIRAAAQQMAKPPSQTR